MSATIRLPSHIQSGMVLQQGQPFLLCGRCSPDTVLTVTLERFPFDGRQVSPLDREYGVQFNQDVHADPEGYFRIELPTFAASFDPFSLRLESDGQQVIVDDILFGEVWVAAGQSNMEMSYAQANQTDQAAGLANLFYLRVLRQNASGLPAGRTDYPFEPAAELSGARWIRGDQPDQIAEISVVAHTFARELHLELHIPIGLIEIALGGTSIHAWMPREVVMADETMVKTLTERGRVCPDEAWNQQKEWPASDQIASLYNSKVAPLWGYPARGLIWYQGESDYAFPAYYASALRLLLSEWQQVFPPADPAGLAFLYVQLAPYYYGHERFTQLAAFNDRLAALRHLLPGKTAVIPIYDLPLDYTEARFDARHPIHPLAKAPIGQRLKTVAGGLIYGRKGPLTAPECSDIEIIGNKMLLSFSNIGEGLRLSGIDDTRLRGFTICGADRVFVEAESRILYGVRVLVWHDQIDVPHAVTYAFSDMNGYANLISRDQLPVLPLRSDRIASRYLPPIEWAHCESLEVWACPKTDEVMETGWHPAWKISRGRGELSIDRANKTEGDGSLFFRYSTDENGEAAVEPILDYASFYPPLDLSDYGSLTIQVFNTDSFVKTLRVAISAGDEGDEPQNLSERFPILPILRWQKASFALDALVGKLDRVRRMELILESKKKNGSISIDQIQLRRPE